MANVTGAQLRVCVRARLGPELWQFRVKLDTAVMNHVQVLPIDHHGFQLAGVGGEVVGRGRGHLNFLTFHSPLWKTISV